MNNAEKAKFIIKDILHNHLPRVQEGLEKGYVDENQILVMYDHAVRARILQEQEKLMNEHLLTPCQTNYTVAPKSKSKKRRKCDCTGQQCCDICTGTAAYIKKHGHPPKDKRA